MVRYHSLAVDEASLPSCLEPIAWTTGAHHAVSLQQSQAEVSSALVLNVDWEVLCLCTQEDIYPSQILCFAVA